MGLANAVLAAARKNPASAATWSAVLGYAKTLSLELAASAITVNTLCPGRIATGRLAKVFGAGVADAANPVSPADASGKKLGDLPNSTLMEVIGNDFIQGTRVHVRLPGDGRWVGPSEGWIDGNVIGRAATPASRDLPRGAIEDEPSVRARDHPALTAGISRRALG